MKSEANASPPKSPRELEATESIANGHIVGHEDTGMKKTFSFLGILALGFNISNSWIAIASSLALTIAAGGTVTILYGILVVGFAMTGTGISLAELASVYPTAGGQYHLTSILTPERFSKGLSYTCGMLGVFSWISIGASIALVIAQAIMALVIQYNPDINVQSWHYFLFYVAVHLIAVLHNLFLAQKTEWIYKLTFYLTLGLFLVVSIACPTRTGARADSSFVWTTFYNNSGLWPDGICFLTGLSGPSFMLIGLDATMHLAEECSAPAKVIPRAIVSTVLVGFLTAFAFAVAMCYSTDDFESLLVTPTGFPIYALWQTATESQAGATVLMVALLCVMMSALNATHQTASRLTWSFARDDAVVLAKYLKRVHPRLHMPVYALFLNFVFCLIAGVLYAASSSAFNAFIGTSAILSQLSITIPIALILYQRRSYAYLPASRCFRVPNMVGYFCNIVAVAWTTLVTVIFCFPTAAPITGNNMNYSSVVIGVVLILGAFNWVCYARTRYQGPRLEAHSH
ncbi:amino acid/polyamine transporter I [Microdochium trichocladiopsis]|uniref:Amino acid/polyamine transporter I n=1 Tax=Microdochium trichocladiopsis TaxID=1682393 RepID=A0A9P8YGM8_9PEZI|nr:amino acid/polyamine transporter I [Microdochium trichocladiopsis]KAH7039573.1 amino acid/polyamine transporter I [Microdochium trichocladiopsis]